MVYFFTFYVYTYWHMHVYKVKVYIYIYIYRVTQKNSTHIFLTEIHNFFVGGAPSLYPHLDIYKHIITYIKIKWATLVVGDPNVSFSIATTPRCRRGRYSIPWFSPLHPWYVPNSGECFARRHQVPFLSLVRLDLRLNLGLPDHWTLYSCDQIACV